MTVEALEDGIHGQLAWVEAVVELAPGERRCHGGLCVWAERVDGDDLLAMAVHLGVDVHAVLVSASRPARDEPCANARNGISYELGEFAGLRVAVGARDRHLDVQSSTVGRFYVRVEVERLECVMDEMGSLDDMAE